MKIVWLGTALLCGLISGAGAADKGMVVRHVHVEPGRLIRLEKSGDLQANVGDLLQIAVGYPVVPGRIVAHLKVEIKGEAARALIVVKTTKPMIVGAGEFSAFIKAEKKGEAALAITPVDVSGKAVGDVVDVKLEVVDKK